MSQRIVFRAIVILLGPLGVVLPQAAAQMIHTQLPSQQLGSSYYEQFGVQWRINGPNFFANFGGAAVPPFGGFDPNSGLRTGFGFQRGNTSGSLGLTFNQGSSRSFSSTTPSLTTTNGIPGSIVSQTVRPFVIGAVPVVSGGGMAAAEQSESQRQAILQSHANQLEIRRQANWTAKQNKALEIFQRGQRAEAAGNLKQARANYRLALGMSQGVLRVEVMKRLQARGW